MHSSLLPSHNLMFFLKSHLSPRQTISSTRYCSLCVNDRISSPSCHLAAANFLCSSASNSASLREAIMSQGVVLPVANTSTCEAEVLAQDSNTVWAAAQSRCQSAGVDYESYIESQQTVRGLLVFTSFRALPGLIWMMDQVIDVPCKG